MDLPLNCNQPLTMHIDLNSCFATIEQQANPLIRHKPVAVAAYDSPHGIILAASYEAKALGIKLGLNVREARLLYPELIVMMPDPDKYFDAHRRLKKVLLNYTDKVKPKSVDEFMVDFTGSRALQQGIDLSEIGYRIKADIRQSVGEYVSVNVGIGPNRFLAKLAANLHKPDGLDVITAANLRAVYSTRSLLDLPGINTRYMARLNMAGIYTPLDFLSTPIMKLKKEIFHGIVGYYWFLRLRGYEIDGIDFARRSYGQQYALGEKTNDPAELSRLLMKLCEKAGRRLRAHDYMARGIHLWIALEDRTHWAKSRRTRALIYATQDIYYYAQRLLNEAPITSRVAHLGVSVYDLVGTTPQQLGLFDDSRFDAQALARAADAVNNKYGEFTITPATMANMQDTILKRVAFGHTDE